MNQQPVSPTRYVAPTSRGDVLFMKAVRWLTEHGVSLLGSRVLTVRGRRTGTPQSVPVNLLTLDGDRYLVAGRSAGSSRACPSGPRTPSSQPPHRVCRFSG